MENPVPQSQKDAGCECVVTLDIQFMPISSSGVRVVFVPLITISGQVFFMVW